MKNKIQKFLFTVLGGLVLVSSPLLLHAQTQTPGNLECKIIFNFKSWSVFFSSGKGEGTITCNDGEKADVVLSTKGGSVFDFGKSDIINGHGKFSPVNKIDELYGTYSSVGGGIGIAKSASGLSLSKTMGGLVNLDLSGTGAGVEIGFHFGDFKIEPKKSKTSKLE